MCSVDSETNNVFEENSTQKHQFLFVYFYEYEFGFISSKFGIVPECSVDSEIYNVF